jgi:alkaline phosphatase
MLDAQEFTNAHFEGLFSESHLSYELEKQKDKEPSLSEMTEKAIQILSRNKKGFFLLVEGFIYFCYQKIINFKF